MQSCQYRFAKSYFNYNTCYLILLFLCIYIFWLREITYCKWNFLNNVSKYWFDLKCKRGARTSEVTKIARGWQVLFNPQMTCVYLYIQFAKENTWNKLVVISGACHADELSYLFYAQIFGFAPKADSPEIRMCKTMSKLWSNFAKTGYVNCCCTNERCLLYGTISSCFYLFLASFNFNRSQPTLRE